MNGIFNILSGGKVTLALFVIIILLVTAFSVTVVIYKAEIKTIETELKQEQLQGIMLQDSLHQANISIDKQNKAIEKIRLDKERVEAQLETELKNIANKKQEHIKQAEYILLNDDSCKSRLDFIDSIQREYLYERKDSFKNNKPRKEN